MGTSQYMKSKNLKLCEIFKSISGEGLRQGVPAVFVRFSGCDMNCDYCDTKYHKYDFKMVSIDDILENEIVKKSKYFVITGGEPFVQHEDIFELIYQLSLLGKLEIETNGSNLYSNVLNLYKKVDPFKVLLTVDYKMDQASELYVKNFDRGLDLIKNKMQELGVDDRWFPLCCIKIVVKNKKEIDKSYELSKKYSGFKIILSPCYGVISPTEMAEYIVDKGYDDLRVQVQLHKYLWEVNARGK